MIFLRTETDSVTRIPSLLEIRTPIPTELINETFGGSTVSAFAPQSAVFDVIAGALLTIRDNPNREVAEHAKQLLLSIFELSSLLERLNTTVSNLPPLQAFNVEDGSILMEWIFPDFRVGFTVEPILAESSWYLVSNERLGEINASGFVFNTDASKMDAKKLLIWLLGFIVSNS